MKSLIIKIIGVFIVYYACSKLVYYGAGSNFPIISNEWITIIFPFIPLVLIYRSAVKGYQKKRENNFGSPLFWALIFGIISEVIIIPVKIFG